MTHAAIINRGRGPEVAGTRITVYDVCDYLRTGWDHDRIATTLRIRSHEMAAAIQYIEDHKDEVLAGHQRILDRDARGNAPELQAKLDATHARLQRMLRNGGAESSVGECDGRAAGGH